MRRKLIFVAIMMAVIAAGGYTLGTVSAEEIFTAEQPARVFEVVPAVATTSFAEMAEQKYEEGVEIQMQRQLQMEAEAEAALGDYETLPIEVTPRRPGEKVAYLTFDDGPGEYTEELLDILDDYEVKATFL